MTREEQKRKLELAQLRSIRRDLNNLYHGPGINEGLAKTSARGDVSDAIDALGTAIEKLKTND